MNILLADDHALYREGLALFLDDLLDKPHFSHATDWFDVKQLLQYETIDLALLDLTMQGNHAWEEELESIIRTYPYLKTCVISSNDNPLVIQSVLRLGVKGYIPKALGIREMQSALTQVLAGYVYVPDQVWVSRQEKPVMSSGVLTWRQQQVLKLLSEGGSNKEIGNELGLSEHTVKRHIYNIFKMLNVKSRLEAVQVSRNKGLLSA